MNEICYAFEYTIELVKDFKKVKINFAIGLKKEFLFKKNYEVKMIGKYCAIFSGQLCIIQHKTVTYYTVVSDECMRRT